MSKKSKELGLQEVYTHMGMFDFAIWCVIGDYANTLKYVAHKFEDDEPSADEICRGYVPRGQCLFKRGYTPVIWIPAAPKTPREYATLAHECIHAVMHMLEWAAVPVTPDSEEVLTHAVSHLLTSILGKIEKTTKPNKGKQS